MTFSGGPFRFSSRFRLSYFVQLTLIPTSWYLEAPTASTALYSSLSSTLHCLHCSCSVSWDHTPLLLLRVPVMGLVRATLVLCLADHATHPPVWSQHSPPVQLPCTVYFTKKHIAADWNVLSISAYCSADALLYHYSRFTRIRARTAVLLMPRKNPIRNFDTKAVPARNELCSSSH